MAGHRDDGTFAEDKAHHPNRKVDIQNAYSLIQAAHQDMSPTAHTMHETDSIYDSKYINAAKKAANNPSTLKSSVILAKGGLVL